MPTGLVALLDDIAGITKLAAASLDDIGAATGKAGSKAIGVVVDDAAVTPRYMVGFSPKRELPMIGKIALGSFRNKLLFILPAALALSAFAKTAVRQSDRGEDQQNAQPNAYDAHSGSRRAVEHV